MSRTLSCSHIHASEMPMRSSDARKNIALTSYWCNSREIIGSICVAVIETEFLLIPIWLGHAVCFPSNAPQISLHIWFLVCWWSLACCIGTVRGLRSLRLHDAQISSSSAVSALTAGLACNVATIAGILIAEGMWMIAYSPPLSAFFGVLVSSSIYVSLNL